MTLRLFLRRLSAVQTTLPRVSQGEGLDQNFGYMIGSDEIENPREQAIQRFAFDPNQRDKPQITYYLKDFPERFHDIARDAVLAWNKAFGWAAIEVKDATADMEIGDPRYNVIRWLESPDRDFGFAGLASPRFSDMSSGAYLSSSIVINGKVARDYDGLILYTEKLKKLDPQLLVAKVGNVPLSLDSGETPLIPTITDPQVGGEDYLNGYYFGTIMHEVGHSLGLMHNFKASTEMYVQNGNARPSSVMDYEPRWMRNRVQEPGPYDIAAIRWAYLREPSARRFAYCDDHAVSTDIYCNYNDTGDPLLTLATAVRKNIELLATQPLEFPETWTYTIMYSEFDTLRKLQKYPEQMPEMQRPGAIAAIDEVFQCLSRVEPPAALSAEEKAVIERHLQRLRASAPEAP